MIAYSLPSLRSTNAVDPPSLRPSNDESRDSKTSFTIEEISSIQNRTRQLTNSHSATRSHKVSEYRESNWSLPSQPFTVKMMFPSFSSAAVNYVAAATAAAAASDIKSNMKREFRTLSPSRMINIPSPASLAGCQQNPIVEDCLSPISPLASSHV